MMHLDRRHLNLSEMMILFTNDSNYFFTFLEIAAKNPSEISGNSKNINSAISCVLTGGVSPSLLLIIHLISPFIIVMWIRKLLFQWEFLRRPLAEWEAPWSGS